MAVPILRGGALKVGEVLGGAFSVSARATGVEEIVQQLEDLRLRARDMRPVLDKFGAYLVGEHIPNQFKQQGTPKRWAALSPAYARWKIKHYGRLPKLVLTGKMRAGFEYKVTPRTLRIVNRAKPRRGAQPYWSYHQFGTGQMPARPVLQLGKKDRARLIEMAHDYLARRGVDVRTGARLGW